MLVAFRIRKSGKDPLLNLSGDLSGRQFLKARSQRVSDEYRSI